MGPQSRSAARPRRWTYGLGGELAAVPLLDKVYDNDFPRAALGLVAAPRVTSYHGMVFASWAATGASLEEYLGADLRWYLDTFAFDDPDGLEVLPGRHRYVIPANWKLLAENFGGDMYHFGALPARIDRDARSRRRCQTNSHERQQSRRDLLQSRVRRRRPPAARRTTALVRRRRTSKAHPPRRTTFTRRARMRRGTARSPRAPPRRPSLSSDWHPPRHGVAPPELARIGKRRIRAHVRAVAAAWAGRDRRVAVGLRRALGAARSEGN